MAATDTKAPPTSQRSGTARSGCQGDPRSAILRSWPTTTVSYTRHESFPFLDHHFRPRFTSPRPHLRIARRRGPFRVPLVWKRGPKGNGVGTRVPPTKNFESFFPFPRINRPEIWTSSDSLSPPKRRIVTISEIRIVIASSSRTLPDQIRPFVATFSRRLKNAWKRRPLTNFLRTFRDSNHYHSPTAWQRPEGVDGKPPCPPLPSDSQRITDTFPLTRFDRWLFFYSFQFLSSAYVSKKKKFGGRGGGASESKGAANLFWRGDRYLKVTANVSKRCVTHCFAHIYFRGEEESEDDDPLAPPPLPSGRYLPRSLKVTSFIYTRV